MSRSPAPLRPLTRGQLLATLALALLVAWLDVRVMPDGVAGAWFFAVVGAIWGALQTAWAATQSVLTFALQNLILGIKWAITNLGKTVTTGLARAAVYTAKTLGVLWRGLRYIFEPVVRWMSKALDAITGFLRRVFQPLIDWLNRAREWITRLYDRYVRPILDVLSVVRQVLRLLAALGLDWARALDRVLGRIYAAIQLPFQWVVGKINEIIGIINRIVTLDGLLQRLTLLRSLIRDVAYVDRLWWNSQTKEMSEAEIAAAQAKHAFEPFWMFERRYLDAIELGEGPLAAIAREWWQQWDQEKELFGKEREVEGDT